MNVLALVTVVLCGVVQPVVEPGRDGPEKGLGRVPSPAGQEVGVAGQLQPPQTEPDLWNKRLRELERQMSALQHQLKELSNRLEAALGNDNWMPIWAERIGKKLDEVREAVSEIKRELDKLREILRKRDDLVKDGSRFYPKPPIELRPLPAGYGRLDVEIAGAEQVWLRNVLTQQWHSQPTNGSGQATFEVPRGDYDLFEKRPGGPAFRVMRIRMYAGRTRQLVIR